MPDWNNLFDNPENRWPDAFFDGLISLFVIYHNQLEKIRKSLAEINRVLRPGGLALITFLSKRGYRYGRGEKIEPDKFISIEGDVAGESHNYSDLTEFDREFNEFIIRQVEYLKSQWTTTSVTVIVQYLRRSLDSQAIDR